MSISTSEAQKHLDKISELDRNSILEWIGNQPPINPFVVDDCYMYFFKGEKLVCVKINEQNGVFVLLFDNQIIEIDSATGNCFIVDFYRNCLEYFCVYDFFQNDILNKHHNFLYLLLIRSKIECMGKRAVRSLRIFFTSSEVVGQIERAGKSSLKSPLGCLSIHEMVRGIKRFIADRFSAFFIRSPCPSIFRTALLTNHVSSQRPSVDQFYGMRLFLTEEFQKHLPSFAMISLIMERFVGNDFMRGPSGKRIAHGFLRMMIYFFSSMMSKKFIENPIGFRQADATMDDLLGSCPKKTSLPSSGFPHSIAGCVSDMKAINKGRDELCEKRRDELFAKQRRIKQEEHQKQQSIQEFRGGIASIKVEFDETRKRVRESDAFEFEDDRSFPKF